MNCLRVVSAMIDVILRRQPPAVNFILSMSVEPLNQMVRSDLRANRVRREGAGPQRGYTRPGTVSLHPVAIRAAVEATRLLEPLVQRVAKATRRACRP